MSRLRTPKGHFVSRQAAIDSVVSRTLPVYLRDLAVSVSPDLIPIPVRERIARNVRVAWRREGLREPS